MSKFFMVGTFRSMATFEKARHATTSLCLSYRQTVFLVLMLIAAAIGTLTEPTTVLARSGIEFFDVHIHLIGGRGNNKDYQGAVYEAIEHMDSMGIRKAIILPPPQISSQNWYDYPSFVRVLERPDFSHRGDQASVC